MSGTLSVFSIINDLTTPQQFKDIDMISSFQTKLKSNEVVFDKFNREKFLIKHSQC